MRKKNCYAAKRKEKLLKKKNVLWRTRTYLIGNMENVNSEAGQSWRDNMTVELDKMGVIVFNPYKKPFERNIEEGLKEVADNISRRARGKFTTLCRKMREIRIFDLNLVDRCDFLIAYIKPTVASWGSAEEIVTAVRMKKPIFLAIEGGKKACPLWIFGMFPHKYIYESPDDIVRMLKRINSGHKKLDNERWKLLRKEFR